MNNYIGKICPFCKTAFNAADEIVVCSDCDMPHHKDCWIENQGCTTFGCLGTIKAVDHMANSVTRTRMSYEKPTGEYVFCTQCGTQHPATAFFCSNCGTRLITADAPQNHTYGQRVSEPAGGTYYSNQVQPRQNAYQQQTVHQNSNYSAYQGYAAALISPELQQLIGTKSEYYLPVFQEMKQQNKKTSWNWAAFLVTPYWLIYRKMYGYGAAVLGAAFLISLIGFGFLSILAFAGYIVMGIYANYIYMTHLESKASQAKNMYEPYKSQYMQQNGGVNTKAMVLTLVGYLLFLSIIAV